MVILSTWSFDDIFANFYTCEYISTTTCRMNFIQSALNKYMSQVSDALFPTSFGPFLESVGYSKS